MSRHVMKYCVYFALLAIVSAGAARWAEPLKGLQETFKSFVAAQNAPDLAALKQYFEENRRATVLFASAVTFGLLLLAVYGAPRDGEYVYEQHIRYMDKAYRDSNPEPFRA